MSENLEVAFQSQRASWGANEVVRGLAFYVYCVYIYRERKRVREEGLADAGNDLDSN